MNDSMNEHTENKTDYLIEVASSLIPLDKNNK